MFVVRKDEEGFYSLPVKEIKAADANILSSDLAIRIIRLLSKKPMYPKEIAESLKENEQKIYYHIRNFERAGIISVSSHEAHQGAIAKYYRLEQPGFVVLFKDLETTQQVASLKGESPFFAPFIKDGKLDSLIIVGSPEPHGPEKARSKDGYYGIDLGLFIGTFLNYVPEPMVRLDTEIKDQEIKENNLIIIGGPIVNKVAGRVNSKLPINFDIENKTIRSSISGKEYTDDETGIIVQAKNPFNKDKSILLVAGKRFSGTKAAMIAFLKHFADIEKGNLKNNRIKAKVVVGSDLDSDGIIDDCEFKE